MRRVVGYIIAFAAGMGLMAFAFKYHVLYTHDGLILVPKNPPGLASPFADVRTWKPSDWQQHPAITRSVLAHGRSDLVGAPGNEFVHDLLRKIGRAESNEADLRTQ